ncbi:transglutaminase domain-containing protein [Paenibacillus tritici]|uniref:transglutaminase TgpA family protein n=1 Tax=Paenibacillus tritici TaxID=1873425 RepID=UPI001BADE6FC|nr:transglutaminase domain-containing protein [Paenibacillus tritici]QUL56424.1 transglutaminase domain-containing protein [Paenibacillus tritici]
MKQWFRAIRSSWHHGLTLLWLTIIALQWVSYTVPFWLEETTVAVALSLFAVTAIEIILPFKKIYRLPLEGAAVLYIIYNIIVHYGVYTPDPLLPAFLDRLPGIAIQMSPYIWFALGAWLLLLVSAWWVNGKTRILMFIAMNITAFAALDSFTTAVLWQEVAWTVFAGMGWLVTQHLRNFQLHYPRGWTYMLKYPMKVALNIAIIFSLVILAGVNMPEVRPTLTDPYTAWQKWNGKSVSSGPSSGNGDSTSSGSGANGTTSGYSLNDDNLGGGFNFDYSPVMTVTSDLRTYMRGETRSKYSGKGWPDDDSSGRGEQREVQVGEPLERAVAPKTETRTLKQTVKLLGGNSYPVVFGGYSISGVDSVDGQEQSSGLSWRSEDSELLWNSAGKTRAYPQTYVVTSEVPVIPFQELSIQTFEQLYGNKNIDPQYLQLPANYPERVSALAKEITARADTPYEKTILLQQYLQQTFPYTNQPDTSRAKSKDMVESFLFEIREGYCDYYSTALVTMARSLDIPARWVKGYAPGEQAEIPDNVMLQQGGTLVNNNYTITNADAHSWAEIYFGDYGWVPVEATPGFNVPVLTQSEQDNAEQTEAPEVEPEELEPAATGQADGDTGFHPGTWVVTGAVAVLLLWGVFLLWQRRLSLRFLITRMRIGGQPTPAQKVIAETQRWVRYVHRKGMLKKEHETLRESVERWSRERPASAESFAALLGMYERANYSPEVIEDKDWHSVYTEALRLRKNMKSGRVMPL